MLILRPLKQTGVGRGLTLYPCLIYFKQIRIYGTVASSPRAVTNRLLGCVGTVRIGTNYTKPPGDPHAHLDVVRAP